MSHYDETRNRFNPENRFIGDIEDGKRYPFACYTKEESDAKYAPISTSTDLTALTAEVATKAAQSDLTALSGVVDTKAAQSDLTALSETVSGKASQTDLTTLEGTVSDLTTTVNGKASQSDLTALSETVATKASSSDLSALSSTVDTLSGTVDTKASASSVTALAAIVETKASTSDLTATNNRVAQKANQSTVDNLSVAVNSKASQASVDSLNSALSTKANQSALDSTNLAVSSKANASDLLTTNAKLEYKADKSELASEVANLQSQIDELEVSGSAEAVVAPEVIAARVGSDSKQYTTLKDRLDGENIDLKYAAVGLSLSSLAKTTATPNLILSSSNNSYTFTTAETVTGNNGFAMDLPVADYGISRIEFDITSENGSPNIFISRASDLSPMTYIYTDSADVVKRHVVFDLTEYNLNCGNNNKLQIWNTADTTAGGYFTISNFVCYRKDYNSEKIGDSIAFIDLNKCEKESSIPCLTLSAERNAFKFTTDESVTGNGGYRVDFPADFYGIKRIEFDIVSNNGSPNIFISSKSSVTPAITVFKASNETFAKKHVVFLLNDTIIANGDNNYFRIWNNTSPTAGGYFTISNFVCFRDQNITEKRAEDIIVGNPLMTDMFSCLVWNNGTLETDDDSITLTPVDGANCGIRSATIGQTTRNFIKWEFNLASDYSTDLTAYIIGKDSNDNAKLVTLQSHIRQHGVYSYTVDLNFYAVYSDLDLSKPFYTALTCGTDNNAQPIVLSEFNIYDSITDLEGVNDVNAALNYLNASCISTSNQIETISTNIKLTDENGAKYVLQVSNGQVSAVPVLASKILYVGNSLLLGFGDFGMAASNNTEDYYSYVNGYLEDHGQTVEANRLQGSTWEGYTSYADQNAWLQNTLLPMLSNDLDLVIVQLGDNVNTDEKMAVFAQGSENLLRFIRTNAPNARVAWVAAWYTTNEKQQQVANACNNTGSVMIDISKLPGISGNRSYVGAIYVDSQGVSHEITNPGVASHPSSQGMRQIADKIISTLF